MLCEPSVRREVLHKGLRGKGDAQRQTEADRQTERIGGKEREREREGVRERERERDRDRDRDRETETDTQAGRETDNEGLQFQALTADIPASDGWSVMRSS